MFVCALANVTMIVAFTNISLCFEIDIDKKGKIHWILSDYAICKYDVWILKVYALLTSILSGM